MFASGERRGVISIVAWAIGVGAAAAFLAAEAGGRLDVALAVKPIPVLLLAVAVFRAGPSPMRGAVGAGLLASAAGDVLIQRPGGFLSGLAAFLVAHVAYLSGFWRARPQPLLARALPVALFAATMGFVLRPGLATAGSATGFAVAVYVGAISIMLWRAAALVGAPGVDAAVGRLALAGAILFAASDSLIAVHRFVAPQEWANVPIMLLYWAGQCGIGFASVRAGRADTSPR
jgi:alkenylglycerophosphocholine hydrolase